EDQQLERSKNMLQQELLKLLDDVTIQAEAAGENLDAPSTGAARSVWRYERSRLMSLDEQLSSELQNATGGDAATQSPELGSTASATSRDALARIRENRR